MTDYRLLLGLRATALVALFVWMSTVTSTLQLHRGGLSQESLPEVQFGLASAEGVGSCLGCVTPFGVTPVGTPRFNVILNIQNLTDEVGLHIPTQYSNIQPPPAYPTTF